MLRVLAFGHLPKEAGGRQSSGLSYAAFEIARGLADLEEDLEYVLSCTDVNSPVNRVTQLESGIKVIGWTKKDLITYSILHPVLAFGLSCSAIRHRFHYRSDPGILRTFGTLLFYSAAVHFYTPDVLHMHGARTVFLDLIPNTKGLPRVTTLHGVIGFDENLPAGCHAIERDALRTNGYFVFVSNKTRNTLLSHYESVLDEYTVISNGIDLQKFRPLDRTKCRNELELPLNKKILLTVGSLSKRKGQIRILDAVASLPHDAREGICCIFVGNGVRPLEREGKAAGVDLRLYEYVKQESLVRFYNAADYHLSASSSEGFGMIMTESIACGTPIIIPKTCDLVEEEFIVDGVNSIVFQKSTVSGIRDVIERALSARFDREKVRNSVISMSWDNVAARYSVLFKHLSHSDS